MPKPQDQTDLLQQQFVLEQLLVIAQGYDLGDDASRKRLIKFIGWILQTVNLDNRAIKVAMESLEVAMPNVQNRCFYVNQIITEIMYQINEEDMSNKRTNLESEVI